MQPLLHPCKESKRCALSVPVIGQFRHQSKRQKSIAHSWKNWWPPRHLEQEGKVDLLQPRLFGTNAEWNGKAPLSHGLLTIGHLDTFSCPATPVFPWWGKSHTEFVLPDHRNPSKRWTAPRTAHRYWSQASAHSSSQGSRQWTSFQVQGETNATCHMWKNLLASQDRGEGSARSAFSWMGCCRQHARLFSKLLPFAYLQRGLQSVLLCNNGRCLSALPFRPWAVFPHLRMTSPDFLPSAETSNLRPPEPQPCDTLHLKDQGRHQSRLEEHQLRQKWAHPGMQLSREPFWVAPMSAFDACACCQHS